MGNIKRHAVLELEKKIQQAESAVVVETFRPADPEKELKLKTFQTNKLSPATLRPTTVFMLDSATAPAGTASKLPGASAGSVPV